jgi:hypothetical protein
VDGWLHIISTVITLFPDTLADHIFTSTTAPFKILVALCAIIQFDMLIAVAGTFRDYDGRNVRTCTTDHHVMDLPEPFTIAVFAGDRFFGHLVLIVLEIIHMATVTAAEHKWEYLSNHVLWLFNRVELFL